MAWDGEQATPLTEPQLVSKARWSADGRVLAYEVLEGINALGNFIIVADLGTGQRWRINSAGGCAILGFAPDPGGGRLALLQVAMRGRFKPAPWQLAVLDLRTGSVAVLAPLEPLEVAFEPVAWSRATDEIVLRAFVAFQANGAAGLWAVKPDGSGLRRLVDEAEYVGEPALSPDGRLLAFFASDPELLPPGHVARPGEPPANVLRLLDLTTGEIRTLAGDGAYAFGALAWGPSGERVYFGRGAWPGPDEPFRFDQVAAVGAEASEPQLAARLLGSLASLRVCRDGRLAYVTMGDRESVAHWTEVGGSEGLSWAVGDASVEVLTCVTGGQTEAER